MPNTVKVPAETWIETAKNALVAEGLAGVKIDRLAKKLGVTRGGFYYHFENHQALLDQLIEHWADSNDFLPELDEVTTPIEALAAFEALVDHLIAEEHFSSAFEMAVREWARIDARVNRVVKKVDVERMSRMSDWFQSLGCDSEEAVIRARVLYFHQIGYYSLGHHKQQSKEERIKSGPVYLRILCGRRFLEAAEEQARKWA